MDEVLENSDYITLHVTQTPETYHLINEEAFEKMKPNAVLINCARGSVIDEKAAVEFCTIILIFVYSLFKARMINLK